MNKLYFISRLIKINQIIESTIRCQIYFHRGGKMPWGI